MKFEYGDIPADLVDVAEEWREKKWWKTALKSTKTP